MAWHDEDRIPRNPKNSRLKVPSKYPNDAGQSREWCGTTQHGRKSKESKESEKLKGTSKHPNNAGQSREPEEAIAWRGMARCSTAAKNRMTYMA